MKGFNEVQMSVKYCGINVHLNFKGGNVVMGKSARLQTDNQFVQDAIEKDERFKYGNIRLVNAVELEPEEVDEPQTVQAPKDVKKGGNKKKAPGKTEEKSGAEVVESVKTLNDVDAWFGAKGIVLEGSGKDYIYGLMEKEGVVFPNLKL